MRKAGMNMANWNLSFDYAAIFLLLLIFVWYINEKKSPLRSHKIFMLLLSVVLLSTGLEILSVYLSRYIDIVGKYTWFTVFSFQHFVANLIVLCFVYYIFLLTHIDVFKDKRYSWFFITAFLVDVVVKGLNPVLHLGFKLDNGVYTLAAGSYVVYAIDCIMVIMAAVTMIRNSKSFLFVKVWPVLYVLVGSIIACLLQVVLQLPLLNFTTCLLGLSIFYYQNNPGTITDIVTKQFNRNFMGEYVGNLFLENREFSVIVIAMDDFKFINKTYGVESGDNLLEQIGNYLYSMSNKYTAFRFGSDQFCVVVKNKVGDVKEVAKLIKSRFDHPWYTESQTAIPLSASICCINCPGDADSYSNLVEVMDYTVSIAKKTNKGRITMAAETDLDRIRNDKAMERAVKMAMQKNELMVYYQPIFSIEKNVYNSAEALVRLHDEELGWISPELFIPLAEKNGMIIEMGEMIFEKVCRFIRDAKLAQTTIEYIEVNISPIQLFQSDFADRIIGIMESYGVMPSQINIEITETANLSAISTINHNINRLVEYGIHFSLDDYGSGNANIDYINQMPFKLIKLDKFIIWDSFKNKKAYITLQHTINMLNALDLGIVAEGVENEEMRKALADSGCNFLQGWFYSKAVPENEFIDVISQKAS
jgi:diguanylate cyclase (GGDEF)-like protein